MFPARLVLSICLLFLLAFGAPLVVAAPSVVVSIKPVHSLVAGVMQGVGEPELLISGGQSPHTFTLRPSDVRMISQSDLIIWVGKVLETPLAKSIAANRKKTEIIELQALEELERATIREGGAWESHGHQDEHEGGHASESGDVHLWLSPVNAKRIITVVSSTLVRLDPVNADTYRKNEEGLLERLDRLDGKLADRLAQVRARPYMVFHDAYQLFERHYELNAVGSIVITPERKPGARRIHALRERIRQLGVRCVFSEPQFEPRMVATIIEQTDAHAGVLDPLGAGLDAGPDAWFQLMENLADSLLECLDE